MTGDSHDSGVALIDPDGRLTAVADALDEHDVPIQTRCRRLEDVETEPNCFVVLDAPETDQLDAVDGLELLGAACEQYDCPVVVYTLREGHKVIKGSLDAGAADAIRVPAKRQALIARRASYAAGYGGEFYASDAQLRSLLRNFPHTLFIKDAVGRFANVTSHTAGNYGFTREQLIGMSDYELFSEAHADELWEEEQRIITEGQPMINDIEAYVDQNGEQRWVSTTKVPRHDDNGEVIGLVGGTQDVTPAKQQEALMAALHEASRELSRATSKPEIAAVTVDIATEIDYLPSVAVALSTGDGLEPVASSDDESETSIYERYESAFGRVHDRDKTHYVDTNGSISRDESTVVDAVFEGQFETDEVGIVIPLDGHGVLGLVAPDGSVDDFTNRLAHVLASNVAAAFDRAQRERKLAQKSRQLEEFATLGSHELRNRLQIAMANVMQEQVERGDSDRLITAERTLERMDRLLTQLLRLARTGKIPQTTETVDVQRAAERAWQDILATNGSVFSPPESATITANPDALTEVFEFLFRNAVEHGSTGPASHARHDTDRASASEPSVADAPEDTVEHGGDGVTINVGLFDGGFYVEDDGVGIPEEMRADLFDVQYADAAHDTGYGLYIVSEIVEAHDWEIDVRESDGGGARFEITGVETHEGDTETS